MSTGKVKWFNAAKGFGFIEPDDKSGDVFVHFTAIEMEGYKELVEGELVEYDSGPSKDGKGKGPAATRVIRTQR